MAAGIGGWVVPVDCLLVEQQHDRGGAGYFYGIVRSGTVVAEHRMRSGVPLYPGFTTDVYVTRGHRVATLSIRNHNGRPRFYNSRGRRDWIEEWRWRLNI